MRKSPHSQQRNELKHALIEARNKAIRERFEALAKEYPRRRTAWYIEKLVWEFYLSEGTLGNILRGFNYHVSKAQNKQESLF